MPFEYHPIPSKSSLLSTVLHPSKMAFLRLLPESTPTPHRLVNEDKTGIMIHGDRKVRKRLLLTGGEMAGKLNLTHFAFAFASLKF